MKIANIHKYITLYDTEKYLFDVVGPSVKERGYLSFEDFYKICMWKSARQKQNYIKNKDSVEEISKNAFAEKDEGKKIKILCELKGVGIPTASAILTVVFPKRYAIIDVRCLEMLREKFVPKIGKYISIKAWLEYLKKMRELADANSITPRELDMALFTMHREKLEKEDFRNLYK
ncbi:MAG: hypothetical protein A2915_02335 [Candidatus Yanofskybacteria bacterium RIFCSPLOWO2_01_FULL_41_34]|nr:MAG: hypothetical protein A2915_02335 [Candidatus Yanofskybacteria bacterium RIFCSPLOWO2_01_FULL_41_34]